jgi:hypothetical protein
MQIARKGAAMNKRKITVGVVAIMLIGGAVWAMMRNRPDPQVEKVKQMQAEAFKKDTTPEQRRQSFELIHQEMEKLTPEQRHEVRHDMHQNFERRMDEEIKTYFSLPQQERIAFLDKQIKEQEKRRKEMEARRNQPGQGPPGAQGGQTGRFGGGSPPRGGSTDQRLQRRDQRLDRSTAEQRSMRSLYLADMRARRIQLGLNPSPFPGRGPH